MFFELLLAHDYVEEEHQTLRAGSRTGLENDSKDAVEVLDDLSFSLSPLTKVGLRAVYAREQGTEELAVHLFRRLR